MGEQAAAAGLAALIFDFRGHGESEGVMDAGGRHDVIAAGETLRRESGAPWLAGRGSSMGGFLLLLAARERPALFRSLVLLCPADPGSLLDGLDRLDAGLEPSSADVPSEGRFDSASLRPFLATVDLLAAARGLPRVLLAHARDDAAVPFAHSERLAAVLAPPTRFIAVESGGHRAPGALARGRDGDHRLGAGERLRRDGGRERTPSATRARAAVRRRAAARAGR